MRDAAAAKESSLLLCILQEGAPLSPLVRDSNAGLGLPDGGGLDRQSRASARQ